MTSGFPMLAALVGILLAGIVPASAVPVSVRFQAGDGSAWPAGVEADVLFLPLSPSLAPLGPYKTRPAAGAAFDLPPDSGWRLEASAPGLWVRSEEVQVGASAAQATVTFFKAGQLTGSLVAPKGATLPRELSLRLRPAPGKKCFPEAKVACPLEKSRFRCPVPAGDFDLRLRAPGYVTHYRWGVRIPLRRALDLGALKLQEGASLVGWIEAPDPAFRFEEVAVAVSPQILGLGLGPVLERKDALELTEKPNDRGFFQFSGVPAGSYLLVARHPRFAPARVAPVEILERSETELRPLALELPADLTVTVSPPLDPYNRPWSLEILKPGIAPDSFDTVLQGPASPEGLYRARNLEPGPYRVAVTGSYLSRWRDEPVEVPPGGATREIRLPLVEVLGEVLYREKPVMVILWFGGKHGIPRIAAKSGPDGRFTVVLPERDEPWRVEAINSLEGIHTLFEKVEVKPSLETGKASLTLKLANTVVRGQVVDDQGNQVPGANVRVTGKTATVEEKASAPEGRFEIKALEPGPWEVEASAYRTAQEMKAETVFLSLAEGEEREVPLVLRPVKKFSGMVVGPAGQPVPGARVYAFLDQTARHLTTWLPETYTDAAGLFELSLPSRVENLFLTVMPPGFAIRQMRVNARETTSLTIPVGQVSGTVILDLGDLRQDPPPWWEVNLFGEARLGFPFMLRQWASLQGSIWEGKRLPVPGLEPGRYTACLGVEQDTFASGLPPAMGDRRCVSGELSAWGTLELRLPGGSPPSGS